MLWFRLHLAAGIVHGIYLRLINILITVTKVRKYIIKAIPASLQNAIGGGIGLFVAYIGFLNVGFVNFGAGVPALATLNTPTLWVFLIGLAITIVLMLLKVKGAMLIAIIATTIIGIPFGVTSMSSTVSFSDACAALPTTFLAIFKEGGLAACSLTPPSYLWFSSPFSLSALLTPSIRLVPLSEPVVRAVFSLKKMSR